MMSRRFTFVSVALTAVVAFLVGAIVAGGGRQSSVSAGDAASPRHPAAAARAVLGAGPGTLVNFADVVERINPAVVNIDATLVFITATVAFAMLRLSGSLTVRLGDSVNCAAFSVYEALVATLESVGASLTAVMLTVSVCDVLRLNEEAPSLSTQVMVLVRFEP